MSDLSDLSVKDLRKLAEERDISLTGLKSKADIITRIEESSTVDRMRAEVTDGSGPLSSATKPEGSPDLWPFMHLPYRKRGAFVRKVAAVFAMRDELEKLEDLFAKEDPSDDEMGSLGGVFDLVAEMQETLLIVSMDEAQFMEWSNENMGGLFHLFGWYAVRFQGELGEALSSLS